MHYLKLIGAIAASEPINFSLLILLTIIAGIIGNPFAVILLLAMIVAEGRIVMLKSQVRVLGAIIGSGLQEAIVASLEGAAHE